MIACQLSCKWPPLVQEKAVIYEVQIYYWTAESSRYVQINVPKLLQKATKN